MKSLIINFLLSNAISAHSYVAMSKNSLHLDKATLNQKQVLAMVKKPKTHHPKDTVIIKSKGKSRMMIINEGGNDWSEFRGFDWNNLMRDVDSLFVRKGSIPKSLSPLQKKMSFDTTITVDPKGNRTIKIDTTYGLMLYKSGPGNYTFERFELNPIFDESDVDQANISINGVKIDVSDFQANSTSIERDSVNGNVIIKKHHSKGRHGGRGHDGKGYRSYEYRVYGDGMNITNNFRMPPLPEFYRSGQRSGKGLPIVKINTTNATQDDKKVELVTDIDFNFGLNNYFEKGSIPSESQYALSPLGSRYFSIRLMQGWRFNNKYRIAIGAEVAWNNYMFENDITARGSSTGVQFLSNSTLNLPPFAKSKMTTTFLNVPVIFRARLTKGLVGGIGAFAGYKVYSYRKIEYGDNNKSVKERNRDQLNLNNFQYGVRAELGFKNVDIFCNYNLSPLFQDGQGPKLTPFSFGIQF